MGGHRGRGCLWAAPGDAAVCPKAEPHKPPLWLSESDGLGDSEGKRAMPGLGKVALLQGCTSSDQQSDLRTHLRARSCPERPRGEINHCSSLPSVGQRSTSVHSPNIYPEPGGSQNRKAERPDPQRLTRPMTLFMNGETKAQYREIRV